MKQITDPAEAGSFVQHGIIQEEKGPNVRGASVHLSWSIRVGSSLNVSSRAVFS